MKKTLCKILDIISVIKHHTFNDETAINCNIVFVIFIVSDFAMYMFNTICKDTYITVMYFTIVISSAISICSFCRKHL